MITSEILYKTCGGFPKASGVLGKVVRSYQCTDLGLVMLLSSRIKAPHSQLFIEVQLEYSH